MSSFREHIKNNPLEELKIFSGKFISIGLLVKYPKRFEEFLFDLEENSYDIKNFEVNIAVPDNDNEFNEISKVIDKTPIEVRTIKLPYGYLNAMKSHNIIIKELSDQSTYFYINNSDRCRFASKNWDLILKQYIGSVPDNMFFLRGSNFSKNMKFRRSAQDAYYFPEQWGVYTRKYLQATDGFLEFHTGHDGPSEMIQYFVSKNKKDPYQRDILMPEIMHSDKRTISSKDTTGGEDRFYERYYINNFFYKSYFSKNGLNILKKCAISIYLHHIIWIKKYKNASVVTIGKSIAIRLSDNTLIHKQSFKLNFFEYLKERFAYYHGVNHGFNFAHRFYFIIKYKMGFALFKSLVFFFNRNIQRVKEPSDNKFLLFPSYFFSFLSNFLTFIFLTEPISNELEGLFRSKNFKNVLHGKNIREAYDSKLYKKSLNRIAEELEKK